MVRDANGNRLHRDVRREPCGCWGATVWFGGWNGLGTNVRRYYYPTRAKARAADITDECRTCPHTVQETPVYRYVLINNDEWPIDSDEEIAEAQRVLTELGIVAVRVWVSPRSPHERYDDGDPEGYPSKQVLCSLDDEADGAD